MKWFRYINCDCALAFIQHGGAAATRRGGCSRLIRQVRENVCYQGKRTFWNQFQCYSNQLFDKRICHIDCCSILQDGNTLLHLNLDRPRVYIYIFASAGVPVNIQNTVRNSRTTSSVDQDRNVVLESWGRMERKGGISHTKQTVIMHHDS